MARANQQDGQLLGVLGSVVIRHEHALAAVRAACSMPPDEFVFLGLTNDIYEKAFYAADLAEGFLRGRGEAINGIRRDAAATAIKALLAAVFLDKSCPPSLIHTWPAPWVPILELIAPEAPVPLDPATVLDRKLGALQLSHDHAFERFGPPHDGRHRAALTIESALLGRSIRFVGEDVAGTKKAAKQRAAVVVLDILGEIANPESAMRLMADGGSHGPSAAFLLAHLAEATVPPVVPAAVDGDVVATQETGSVRSHDTDVPCGGRSRSVPVEEHIASDFLRASLPEFTEAERSEAALVQRYVAWLARQGRMVVRNELRILESTHPFYTDLFDVTSRELIEAKSSASRDHIRLAIGQLIDYGRSVDHDRLAVLTPARPESDLVHLLHHAGMASIFEADDGSFLRLDA
ncbi:double-stranded RNA binding motif domain-containing protein [Catellatospora tritici]|uniref:double-stranded RNA binding motif domain-containing protein n=1 Tax=Catellatospora tritici TaxID=2851566 RepID=UPI001C2DE9FD|nr:double-stranded RNA binding motif domain-containing protein [Catellatospora tritici]MBV1855779.1 hypothetical protein [Catellatospora tritici]